MVDAVETNLQGLNPRLVGQVFRLEVFAVESRKEGLNPRLVGQVFRQNELLAFLLL